MFQAGHGRALGERPKGVRVFACRGAIAFGILSAWTAPLRAQAIRDDFPLPNGTVYAVAQASGTLYVGGSFTRIGPRAAYGAVLSPVTGEIVGGCCMGPVGGELLHEIIAAMSKRMTVRELAAMPHYHPTLAEIWTYPAEELAEKINEPLKLRTQGRHP